LLLAENLPAQDLRGARREQGIVVEPAASDFTTLLRNAALSISQAGYNTTIETCVRRSRRARAFATERETEQRDRAQALCRARHGAVVPPGSSSAHLRRRRRPRGWPGRR
jgi:predicted glycosyltransferase